MHLTNYGCLSVNKSSAENEYTVARSNYSIQILYVKISAREENAKKQGVQEWEHSSSVADSTR